MIKKIVIPFSVFILTLTTSCSNKLYDSKEDFKKPNLGEKINLSDFYEIANEYPRLNNNIGKQTLIFNTSSLKVSNHTIHSLKQSSIDTKIYNRSTSSTISEYKFLENTYDQPIEFGLDKSIEQIENNTTYLGNEFSNESYKSINENGFWHYKDNNYLSYTLEDGEKTYNELTVAPDKYISENILSYYLFHTIQSKSEFHTFFTTYYDFYKNHDILSVKLSIITDDTYINYKEYIASFDEFGRLVYEYQYTVVAYTENGISVSYTVTTENIIQYNKNIKITNFGYSNWSVK
jgi:hypothetical protein